MLGKRAKILSDANIRDLLAFTTQTRYPLRNRVIVLLSVKAGLRASEIANLTWPMITEAQGLGDADRQAPRHVTAQVLPTWRPTCRKRGRQLHDHR